MIPSPYLPSPFSPLLPAVVAPIPLPVSPWGLLTERETTSNAKLLPVPFPPFSLPYAAARIDGTCQEQVLPPLPRRDTPRGFSRTLISRQPGLGKSNTGDYRSCFFSLAGVTGVLFSAIVLLSAAIDTTYPSAVILPRAYCLTRVNLESLLFRQLAAIMWRSAEGI